MQLPIYDAEGKWIPRVGDHVTWVRDMDKSKQSGYITIITDGLIHFDRFRWTPIGGLARIKARPTFETVLRLRVKWRKYINANS